ncbi:pulmonary surfactant-associated protein C-like [Rhinatrema bivittatum]|uniref:pulmonary surfactant-associated protein C-like n=1 Tax=Rhinatrema bivittatum TaxID=194408 RepID=UPI001126CF9E|nr:pulmonary surfactant-associated protein C-like [Rhinatrema bivittatum]
METGSKTDLVESPPVYSFSPKNWSDRKKKVGTISIVVVVLSLIAVAAILIGVKMTQAHTEKIFQITHNEDGKETQETATVNKKEGVATFYVTGGNTSATVVYDYTNTVIGIKGDPSACYVTRMDKSKVPSLDSISQKYQSLQASSPNSISGAQNQQSAYFSVQKEPVADRSVLGTTINVLCSNNPIYWMQESSGAARSVARRFCIRVRVCNHYFCFYALRCF